MADKKLMVHGHSDISTDLTVLRDPFKKRAGRSRDRCLSAG